MKKFITVLLLAVMSFGAIAPTFAAPFQQHLKKDGTPDKRFKENKDAKGPVKKDGTPDMRHKANKPTPPPPPAPPAKPGKSAKPKKK